jgi:hypothetical protein
MNINRDAIKYYKKNWKMFLHLFLRTKRFGVNNKWYNDFDSDFGLPFIKILWRILTIMPLIVEWQKIKFRIVACHFISDEDKEIIGL